MYLLRAHVNNNIRATAQRQPADFNEVCNGIHGQRIVASNWTAHFQPTNLYLILNQLENRAIPADGLLLFSTSSELPFFFSSLFPASAINSLVAAPTTDTEFFNYLAHIIDNRKLLVLIECRKVTGRTRNRRTEDAGSRSAARGKLRRSFISCCYASMLLTRKNHANYANNLSVVVG